MHKRTRRVGTLMLACIVSLSSLLFMGLGHWQLDRAEQSQAVARTVRERAALPPVPLTVDGAGVEEMKYRRVFVQGEFEPGDRIFIDGRKRNGRLGYHLIVPFRVEGSKVRLLVNRGWVSDTDIPALSTGSHVQGVVAAARVPPLRMGLGTVAANRPWPYLDVERFARTGGYPVLPFVLIEQGPLADEVIAAGLERADKWGMHIGYAIQWFVFALLAGILAIFMIRTGSRRKR